MRRAIASGVAAGALLAALAFAWFSSPNALPNYDAVRASWRSSDGLLLARDGRPLDRRRIELGTRRLQWIPSAAISPALRQVIVEAEDRRFADHHGVDWLAVGGALRDQLLRGKRRGASTITMQLAVLLDPSLRKNTSRSRYKLRQMRAALALERTWSKDEILETYLNRLGFRGDLVGLDAAARLLFGKAPAGLTRSESLLLAALLPAPTAAPTEVAARACALDRATSCDELERLAAEVFATRHLAEQEGLASHLAATLIDTADSEVTTTLDRDLQQFAIATLARHVGRDATSNMRDGAVLIADVATGAIRAYVGANHATSTAPHVDGVRARRQAGSTLKPFLYGLALERGYLTAASLLDDSPLNLNTASGLYLPQNYDRGFAGLVSVRTALASSLNIPAVRTLVLTGVEPFRDRLVASGYRDLVHDGAYYGYALALGSAEVTLWQQVAAYRALARGGLWSELHLVAGAPPPDRRILSEGAAAIVVDILADRGARVPTFGVDNVLATPFWSAVKTGTSKDMRDNWCIGFTPHHVVGVWVGNFEGDSMRDVSGVSGAAPIWQELLAALHTASQPPPRPVQVVAAEVRFEPPVEPARRELFIAGTELATSRAASGSAAPPRITSPANGVVIAIDPDIPANRQRVPFTASVASDLEFVLDGTALGTAHGPLLWPPRPGAHRLLLRDATGQAVDQVLFTVR
ncbi:MAG: penicillin-binding protein 1C [Gammaproteobacteria bacterium]|nr:penicillin-binding protein 1C [Gammaproteobacteria bacterium]